MIRPLPSEACSTVELEVWEMPTENFGRFIEQVSFDPLPTSCIQSLSVSYQYPASIIFSSKIRLW